METKLAAGIDLGGTKIRAGLVTETGSVIGEVITLATPVTEGTEAILAELEKSVKMALGNTYTMEDLAGVGIGAPGPLSIYDGKILTPQNLKPLHDCLLRDVLTSRLKTPVFLNNDANAFALAESFFGAAKDASVAIGITLGTGLGCGITFDNKLYIGRTETAAEIWCSPYGDGILEDVLSGTGLQNLYKKSTGEFVPGVEIAGRAKYGEPAALDTWQEFGTHLGRALAWLVNMLDPDVIVIGGSVSNSFELFEIPTRESLHKFINPMPKGNVVVSPAQLGDDAGFIGAAALVFEDAL
ncbi:ROK family protein [bacterium]|nr:ROK family protein [bacterium]